MQNAPALIDSRTNAEPANQPKPKGPRPLLDPLRVLVACGWLPPSDAADPRLRVDTLTRSHQVVRVTAPDGRAVIVKQPMPEARQSGRSLYRELYIYRLASWMEALSKILPAPLLIDEGRQLLVCECLSFAPNWPDELEIESLAAPGVARELGQAMAGWHHETKEIALEPSPAPGILYITDSLEPALEGRSESAQTFMRSLPADPEFRQALEEGANLYEPSCLIHGDIRPDNWVVRRSQSELKFKVFDWEMSGLGDPAWEIGSACSESVLQLIRSGLSTDPDESGWPSLAKPTLHEFLSAYTTARRDVDPSGSILWDRVTLFAAARLLHVASEWAEYSHNIDSGGVERIVAQARNLLRAREQAAASLGRLAQA